MCLYSTQPGRDKSESWSANPTNSLQKPQAEVVSAVGFMQSSMAVPQAVT